MRLAPRQLRDRVTWRRVRLTSNEFGESVRAITDTEVAASVQPLKLTDDESVAGTTAVDRRAVFMREAPAITDEIVVAGEAFNIQDIRAWPSHARVVVVRAE